MSSSSHAFIVVERDLLGRFPDIEYLCEKNIYVVDAKAKSAQGMLRTVFKRVCDAHILRNKLNVIPKNIYQANLIFLSNTEGYIARNLVDKLRQQNQNATIVSLQHGIFSAKQKFLSNVLGDFLYWITMFFFGVGVNGRGFFNPKVDGYIVYNSNYKSQLVGLGANPVKVIVSTEILKGAKFWARSKLVGIENGSILFLLQPLSELGLISKTDELELINAVVKFLSQKYKRVLIKQHPYASIENIVLYQNCEMIKEPVGQMNVIPENAISFFSEGLNELEFLGANVSAIYDEKIRVTKGVYKHFSNVVALDGGALKPICKNKIYKPYYQSEISLRDFLLRVAEVLKR